MRMFLRVAMGVALGAGLLAWFASARPAAKPTQQPADPRASRKTPEWHSDYVAGPDGLLSANALVDGAVADTFPASDPPSYMASVVAGSPPRTERAKAAVAGPTEARA